MNAPVKHPVTAATKNRAQYDDQNFTTQTAVNSTALNPRFYTTDFDEMDKLNIEAVRQEWDVLINDLKADGNKGHFKRNDSWEVPDIEGMDPELRRELTDFFVSSLTAEFSGCVLYKEMKRRGTNQDVIDLFGLMSRDESRHASFINDALKDFGIGVNMGFLAKAKKYTYFKPKYIYYATYLSEKIGYARYITIYRHLEKNPEYKIHPIFNWFKEWCNDEFKHGEAFALIMRANPELLEGRNRLWIRFFQLAVYATMYVRDHQRPAFHKALGIDIDDYDMSVFEKTREISKQVFPVLLDLGNPKLLAGFKALERINRKIDAAADKPGLGGKLTRGWLNLKAGAVFAKLYFLPTIKNELPDQIRLQPSY